MWGSDLSPDYTPYEAGLDRFVRLNKGEFIGKAALQKQLEEGVPHRFITFEVHDVGDADALGNEPLFDTEGNLVGRATAGYYGHALGKSLGLGYVKPAFAGVGTELSILILGERRRATVLVDSPYDPDNKDLRA
jgi:dimethylglycine dehydrogenase